MTDPAEFNSRTVAFETDAEFDAIVAWPPMVPKQFVSVGGVTVTVDVAFANCSAGPLDGCASPEIVTVIGDGLVIAPEIRAGADGHHATACNGTHN